MKARHWLTIWIVGISNLLFAHSGHEAIAMAIKHWTLDDGKGAVDGSFLMFKDGEVYIEKVDQQVEHFPLSSFSLQDQAFVVGRYQKIQALNHPAPSLSSGTISMASIRLFVIWTAVFLLGLLAIVSLRRRGNVQKWAYAIAGLVVIAGTSGFGMHAYKVTTTTDPLWMDQAFIPFKPKINTNWDNTYFYVESKGIPDHPMMVGITSWQQQVPIPQCYIGNNHWSIPLNPVIAANPVPVNNQHFLRGAVAVAVNGVPIFNPYTNTGVDAFLTGQLDNWGGHCGRADDYHYHIAPLTLYSQTADTLPIAFALDGFAVYGAKEPDGQAMTTLDGNHGHYYGPGNVYHYHGSATAPYMIGNMVGQVTEDNTLQIIPQAAAHPVRPSLTPLNGAVITDCQPNGTGNGYNLTFTRNSQTYEIHYSWTTNVYTFHFIDPGATRDSVYNGFTQCTVPVAIDESLSEGDVQLYPNPSDGSFSVKLPDGIHLEDIHGISVLSATGGLIYESKDLQGPIRLANLPAGNYLVRFDINCQLISRKLQVR